MKPLKNIMDESKHSENDKKQNATDFPTLLQKNLNSIVLDSQLKDVKIVIFTDVLQFLSK